MKLIAATIIATTVLTPHVALADWVEVAHSRAGDRMFVDDDSIAKEGSYVSFRSKMAGGSVKEISMFAADCQSGQYQLQDNVVNDHRVVLEGGFPVSRAPLGSLGAAAIQYACGSH